MRLIAEIIVRHSFTVLFIVAFFSITLSILPLVLHEFPSFNEPVVGFETRGTKLAGRFIAWENLIEELRPFRSIASNPKDIEDELRMNDTLTKPNTMRKKKHKNHKGKKSNKSKLICNNTEHSHFNNQSNVSHFETDADTHRKNNAQKKWKGLKEMDTNPNNALKSNVHFCGSPQADYAHYFVQSIDGSSLMNFENIMSLCELQLYFIEVDSYEYENMCEKPEFSGMSSCCSVWSLPNYLSSLVNQSSCFDLTPENISNAVNLIKMCAPYYHTFKLHEDCFLNKCECPAECYQNNAVYNILFYLVDYQAFSENDSNQSNVKNSAVFMPIPCSSSTLQFYLNIQPEDLQLQNVEIVAMKFGLKNSLFDVWLIEDMSLVALGGLFVLACVWFYVGSFFLTLMLFLSILFSLGVSYFIYVDIYRIDFFPFMNLLVAVVVIGIGADDAFLYIKVWEVVKDKVLKNEVSDQVTYTTYSETVWIKIVAETLKHSYITMLVTTVTTAVAFFASYVSYIPAINCFSIFAGTAVMVNFFLVMIWMPVCVFILETKINPRFNWKFRALLKNINDMCSESRRFLVQFITTSVTKFSLLWIAILTSLGIWSCFTVFVQPGLQLPDSKYLQLFSSNHLFERYEMEYKNVFLFERSSNDLMYGGNLPLRWVWGVRPVDNGDHMNPASTGTLELDSTFNISDISSQSWLIKFCAKIKSAPFYQLTVGPMLANCFIETFVEWMNRPCLDFVNNHDLSPCCESSTFPFEAWVFDICIVKAVESLYQTPRQFFVPGIAGPKFLKNTTPLKVAALVVEFESVQPFTMSYTEINSFYQLVENWTQAQLRYAPKGVQNGWFISELQFYDLQDTLASGTLIALGLSSVLGFVILLPSTLSITISLCGVIAMGFSVMVTVAILILMGWKLNVLESIAISTSAGLAVDFSLHYTLSYAHASGTRAQRALSAMNTSLSPTAAAAITTGFSGIFLLRSNILPYRQIGMFFAIIMGVSWVYSTWLLSSLLHVIGPEKASKKPNRTAQSVLGINSICSDILIHEAHELNPMVLSTNPNVPCSPDEPDAEVAQALTADDCKQEEKSLE